MLAEAHRSSSPGAAAVNMHHLILYLRRLRLHVPLACGLACSADIDSTALETQLHRMEGYMVPLRSQ